MEQMRIFTLTTLASALALLASAAPAATARSAPRPRCQTKRVVSRTAKVTVYEKTTHVMDDSGEPEYGIYVCWRAAGKSHLLGYDDAANDDVEYGPENALVATQVAGKYVAVQLADGLSDYVECEKYTFGEPGCAAPTTTIAVASAPSGRHARFAVKDGGGNAIPLSVSSAGALAWSSQGLFAVRLTPLGKSHLNGHATLLDPAPGGLTSVTGLTVNWFDLVGGAHVPHSASAPAA
jgi:hypothetical protein